MRDDNLFAHFRRVATRQPDIVAIHGDDGTRWTYGDLDREAGQFSGALKKRRVQPGDRVVVQVAKSPANVALYLGCLQSGAVYVPLNTAYTDSEIGYFLDDCRPALVVHDSARRTVSPASATLGQLSIEASAHPANTAIARRGGADLAAICYTSGTTGRSKGAMISHDNLLSNALTLIDLWRFSRSDVLLHILPIFHVHGLFVALHCALLSGASILLESQFDADRTLDLLPRSTVLMGVPTHYTRLLAGGALDVVACQHMRLFLCGSAPLLAETHQMFAARTGHRILERYGMTEAGMITSNPYEGERIAGTVGYPLPGVETRISALTGAIVEGETGALEISGPNVVSGYWEMPEKTAESFTADGWFITGDLCRADVDGRLTIVGRSKDLIISGGYNIYPKEIELVLDALPDVAESAVIGIPHADFGEAVVAVIVPAPGATIDEAALAASVASQLARFKHPRQYHMIDDLPRNAMGKVQKALLRDRFAGA